MRYSVLLSVVLAFIVAGCGFQLRGTSNPLPQRFQQTYLAEDLSANEHFYRQVKQLIHLNEGRLVSQAQAKVTLFLSPITVKSRQIALAGTGTLKEYEKNYQLTVKLVETASHAQLGSREISVSRTIQIDDSKVLAGEETLEIAQKAAERSLAQSVIRYLKSFK